MGQLQAGWHTLLKVQSVSNRKQEGWSPPIALHIDTRRAQNETG